MSSETWTATCGTNARRTRDLQSSSPEPLGELIVLLANSEFNEETELWTGAVEEERRYIEGDLGTPTEGMVGRRGRDGNADAIEGRTRRGRLRERGRLVRSGCGRCGIGGLRVGGDEIEEQAVIWRS